MKQKDLTKIRDIAIKELEAIYMGYGLKVTEDNSMIGKTVIRMIPLKNSNNKLEKKNKRD